VVEPVPLSSVVTFYFPGAILGISIYLGLREWRLFQTPGQSELDPFPSTRLRLLRRWLGTVVLVAIALTLASLGRWPPCTVAAASHYLAWLAAELGLLVLLLMLDLWALGRPRARGRR
jgi:hypothetical protein